MRNFKKIIFGSFISVMALNASALADDVTLTMWSIDDENQPAPLLAKEFSDLDNGIKIEYLEVEFDDLVSQAMRAIVTGQGPDIITVDNPEHALFASRGAFLDLTDAIEKSDIIAAENYYPGPLESVSWEGKIYGVPKATNTIALYYNVDMFKAKGLDPDNPPKTWDELVETARKLNDPENSVYGIAFSAKANEEGTFQFLPWLQMGGGDFTNVSTPGSVRALDIWKTLLDEKLASPETLTRGQWDSTGTFNAGNAAMVISGPWELERMTSDAKFEYRVALLPTAEEGGARSSAMGDFNWAIFKNSSHPEEAFQALEYFASQDHKMFEGTGLIPARSDIDIPPTGVALKDKAFKVFEEQLKYARPRGPHPDWPKISKAIQDAIQLALTGKKTSQAALDDAEATISTIIGK